MQPEAAMRQDQERAQAPSFDQALEVLRQFRGAHRSASRAVERCELCSAELHSDHAHLVELTSRQIACACDPCAMLFDGLERSKYKRVPRRIQFLSGFALSDAQWDSLYIPINLAFFVRSSIEGRTLAQYPSPAGAVESSLTLTAWNEIVECNPRLQHLQSDVEALLANRVGRPGESDSAEYFIAPIDECYKLVGLIRANWKGLSGGTEVWAEVVSFFDRLRAGSETETVGQNA
jgi:hypothetical protein